MPKEHSESLTALDQITVSSLFQTTRTVGTALREAFDADSLSLFHTTGPLVGNVTHVHIHVLPRFTEDSIHLGLQRIDLDEEVGDVITNRVRDNL